VTSYPSDSRGRCRDRWAIDPPRSPRLAARCASLGPQPANAACNSTAYLLSSRVSRPPGVVARDTAGIIVDWRPLLVSGGRSERTGVFNFPNVFRCNKTRLFVGPRAMRVGLKFCCQLRLEAADAFSESLAEFGKLLRSEHKQSNSEDNQQVHRLKQSFKHKSSLGWAMSASTQSGEW